MPISQVAIERLSILIWHMDTLDAAEFTMRQFFMVSPDRHGCRAPACALGWATTIPALNKSGLTQSFVENLCTAKPVNKFFDAPVYGELFASSLSGCIQTPSQWSANARAWLAERGVIVPERSPVKESEGVAKVPSITASTPAVQPSSDPAFARFLARLESGERV